MGYMEYTLWDYGWNIPKSSVYPTNYFIATYIFTYPK